MSSKVYVIANFEIKDTDNFRNYEKGFFGILKKHGGEFITFDDAPEKIEGQGLKGRVAMWTFNSKDEFDKCTTMRSIKTYRKNTDIQIQ